MRVVFGKCHSPNALRRRTSKSVIQRQSNACGPCCGKRLLRTRCREPLGERCSLNLLSDTGLTRLFDRSACSALRSPVCRLASKTAPCIPPHTLIWVLNLGDISFCSAFGTLRLLLNLLGLRRAVASPVGRCSRLLRVTAQKLFSNPKRR